MFSTILHTPTPVPAKISHDEDNPNSNTTCYNYRCVDSEPYSPEYDSYSKIRIITDNSDKEKHSKMQYYSDTDTVYPIIVDTSNHKLSNTHSSSSSLEPSTSYRNSRSRSEETTRKTDLRGLFFSESDMPDLALIEDPTHTDSQLMKRNNACYDGPQTEQTEDSNKNVDDKIKIERLLQENKRLKSILAETQFYYQNAEYPETEKKILGKNKKDQDTEEVYQVGAVFSFDSSGTVIRISSK